jgi:hypothetical protein
MTLRLETNFTRVLGIQHPIVSPGPFLPAPARWLNARRADGRRHAPREPGSHGRGGVELRYAPVGLSASCAHAWAGCLGVLTAVTQPTPELLRAEIKKTRALTNKPFGVNISFLPAATPPDYEAYIKGARRALLARC